MNNETTARRLRMLVCSLVLLLILEGLIRKKVGGTMKTPVFFFKDVIMIVMAFYVVPMFKSPTVQILWRGYMALVLLFVPVIAVTAIHDPVLAVFGAERYLMMPIVAFAVLGGFERSSKAVILKYLRVLAIFVVPTTLLAVMQLRLPMDHWLNLSVAGDELGAFASSGRLRVASTFSFVAQYCFFLNIELIACVAALSGYKQLPIWKKILYVSLIPALLLGAYATGSRTAVLGNASVTAIATGVLVFKGQRGTVLYLGAGVAAAYVSFLTLQAFFPEAFSVYREREEEKMLGISSETETRTTRMFTDLIYGNTPISPLGYGLGVMSNGAEKLSEYARRWRSEGYWTETDWLTTLFEGGLYLMFVWYGFRLWIIAQTMSAFLRRTKGSLVLPTAFCQGFIIVQGFVGTLGIQPPLAIWFWMVVGISTLFVLKCEEEDEEKSPVPAIEGEKPAVITTGVVRGRSKYAEWLHSGART